MVCQFPCVGAGDIVFISGLGTSSAGQVIARQEEAITLDLERGDMSIFMKYFQIFQAL
jgi:hypothetical protein